MCLVTFITSRTTFTATNHLVQKKKFFEILSVFCHSHLVYKTQFKQEMCNDVKFRGFVQNTERIILIVFCLMLH